MEYYTRSYLQLIKPGITLSNTITAAAGFFLASSSAGFDIRICVGVIAGVALVIASACVVNNIIDRRLDARMKRTKNREVAAGKISVPAAGVYALLLAAGGFGLLFLWTNTLTALLGVVAYVWYIAIYGFAKRTTPLSTIIGAVCGALPPMAGYVALTGTIDGVAWILFWLMMVWQLPHFYAIAIFRRADYKNARLPVWSVRYGIKSTKAQIFFWIVVYALLVPLPVLFHVTGSIYLLMTVPLALYWVIEGVRHYRKDKDEKWAKRMFGISLLMLLVMAAAIAIGGYLP